MIKENKIAIIGLGYVGLPLAVAFSKHFQVIGYDISFKRIQSLNKSIDSNRDMQFTLNDKLSFTSDLTKIETANIIIITVPTPVTSSNIPDLSILKDATYSVSKFLKKGDIVIYESTVYPGVTEEICVPILEKGSLLGYNQDFYCGYSPERISPGLEKFTLQNVVKITSGSNDDISNKVDLLYQKIISAGTYKAPSIKVAEAAKVVENTQRDVNIALMNELAMMFDKMSIDTTEVLDAAKTKWNFLDFKPGLVGGHCIGVDPYYLLHKSEESGYIPNLLHSSRKINNQVAGFIVEKTLNLLSKEDKNIADSSVLIFGYTFKENCADIRNTKVKEIAEGLLKKVYEVDIYDPYISVKDDNIFTDNPFESNQEYDAIIIAVAHDEFLNYSYDDFVQLSKGKLVLLDIKGVYNESTWKF